MYSATLQAVQEVEGDDETRDHTAYTHVKHLHTHVLYIPTYAYIVHTAHTHKASRYVTLQ